MHKLGYQLYLDVYYHSAVRLANFLLYLISMIVQLKLPAKKCIFTLNEQQNLKSTLLVHLFVS